MPVRLVTIPCAAAVAAVVALSAWTGRDFRRHFVSPGRWCDDEPQIRLRHVADVRTAIPGPTTLGYVCDHQGMEAAGLTPIKEYLITQYCLVPHLLVRGTAERLVLVDTRHADPERLRGQLPREREWVEVRDFGNGLRLLRSAR